MTPPDQVGEPSSGEIVSRARGWSTEAGAAGVIAFGAALLDAMASGAIIVAVGTRHQFAALGAYTAGTVGTSLAAIVLSFGTSFQYVTGTPAERHDIRALRVNVTGPALVVVSLLLSVFYGNRGYLGPDVFYCGAAVALNNLSEIAIAGLNRNLRFLACNAATLGSKLLVAVLVIGFRRALPLALLVGAVVQLLFLELLSGDEDRLFAALQRPFRKALWGDCRRAVVAARAIGTFTVLAFAASRLDSFVLSIFASPTTTGRYGAIYSIYLAVVGILFAVLQVVVPLRRDAFEGDGHSHLRINTLRRVCVAAGLVAGVVLAWQAQRTTALVLGRQTGSAAKWLLILAVSLPFLLGNRAAAIEAIARRGYSDAARVVAVPAITGLGILMVAVPVLGATGAALATCVQEVIGFVAVAAFWARARDRRQRPRDGMDNV